MKGNFMISLHPFNASGKWYKGNLHSHSTESDGIRSPMEVMDWYSNHGYAFNVITDHNRLTIPEKFGTPSLLAIPGTELTCRRGDQEYHILGIGLNSMPIESQQDPQQAIDAINAVGGIGIIAHPYWHDLQLDDMLPLTGHHGIEIYNTGCWIEQQRGHALVHWDALTSRGQKTWGYAVDDSHWKTADHGGGWIVVKAKKLDQVSIIKSIKQGDFYSSCGPEIHDISIEGDMLTVKCSPARSVYVFDQYHYSPLAINAWDGDTFEEGASFIFEKVGSIKPITEATFKINPRQEIIRIEVVDYHGRSAWSNPYFKNSDQITWE
jgi:hypothetical protein